MLSSASRVSVSAFVLAVCLVLLFYLLAGAHVGAFVATWLNNFFFPTLKIQKCFHTAFHISDLPNLKYCVKIKITTCMWLGALRLRSSQQRKLLKSFGEVSWCRCSLFFFLGGLFVVRKQSCCMRSLVFWTQVRRSAGLQTRNWTVSPAALTVCSLLNWHKHLWMQMETMCFRSELILMPSRLFLLGKKCKNFVNMVK